LLEEVSVTVTNTPGWSTFLIAQLWQRCQECGQRGHVKEGGLFNLN